MLTAVHPLFSTGHTAGEGDALVREELCDRALQLVHTLVSLLPEQAETRGLLGLLLITDAPGHPDRRAGPAAPARRPGPDALE